MAVLKVILILVEVLTCFLLIGLILLQRSKNEGMGGLAMGSGMGEALFGSRAGNVLTRATVVLACLFLGCTTLLAFTYSQSGREPSAIEKELQKLPSAPAPQQAPMTVPTPVAAPAPAAPVEATPASVNLTIPAPEAPVAPAVPAAPAESK